MAPCARCGTFLCGDCTELVRDAAWCDACIAWQRQNGTPSRWVQLLIGVSIAGIFCFPVCGPVAPLFHLVVGVLGLWVPTRELRRIQAGEGPVRGAWQAKAARVLAALNLVVMLGWAALYLLVWSESHGP